MIDVSIVIPIKDEAVNIEPLAEEIRRVMDQHSWRWECIWVDDGSTDDSLSIIARIHHADTRHRFVSFKRNSGQSAAFFAGFDKSRGPVIATLDGDGQNDPADLPKLIAIVHSGRADMANGYRKIRQDRAVRKLASKIANGFRNWTTGRTVRDVGCSTRAFRRECTGALPRFAGMHRFLPTLVSLHGFHLIELPVNHRPRRAGTSKYTIGNRLWVGLYDAFGVMWLKKRAFRYTIKTQSR
jgi:dolichol-phosphate mannosyltransferase